MDPFTLLMIGSKAVGAAGQLAAGKAQQAASELTAFRTETEAEFNKAAAMQQARARREEYDLAMSSNIAMFAASRDVGTDRSIRAFMERQREIIGQDLGRIDVQAQMESQRMQAAAATERRRGRNIQRASLFSAVGTLGEGLMQYNEVR